MDDHLTWADATEQAALVARGDVSPLDLVDAAIERIERSHHELNAVIHERFEQARMEARLALEPAPFRGVPLVLKDWGCRSVGDPYHLGSRFLRRIGWRADHDSVLTTKFRAAGFIIVGRTNTPELAMSMTTEPLAYGASHNPWNLDHSTGGSSGGSAAAVAAGLVAVAHANDGGGSIRIPASACGLVGLKPTRGRVSQGPDAGGSWAGALIDHALTRTVRDSAATLDAIAGYVPGDPYTAPKPARPFVAEVGVEPARLRVGLLDHAIVGDVELDPECAAAVRATGVLLERLGHRVEDRYPGALRDLDFGVHFGNLVSACCAADLDELSEMTGQSVRQEEVEPHTLAVAARGRALSASGYVSSLAWLQRFERRMSSWWAEDGFDLLVTPVLAGPPPPLGWLTEPGRSGPRTARFVQYVRQYNATGQPAISLPLHWTPDGLPVGVQLIARYGREDVLIRVAAQLERAHPWSHRRPSLYTRAPQAG